MVKVYGDRVIIELYKLLDLTQYFAGWKAVEGVFMTSILKMGCVVVGVCLCVWLVYEFYSYFFGFFYP